MAISMITLMVSFFLSKLFSSELAPKELFLFKFGALDPCKLDQSADQITMKPFAFEVVFYISMSTSCPYFMVIVVKYNFRTMASSVRAKLGLNVSAL